MPESQAAQLVARLTAAEASVERLTEELATHRAELHSQNERHQTLIAELRTLFEGQQVEFQRSRRSQEDIRREVAELTGARCAAAPALVG